MGLFKLCTSSMAVSELYVWNDRVIASMTNWNGSPVVTWLDVLSMTHYYPTEMLTFVHLPKNSSNRYYLRPSK